VALAAVFLAPTTTASGHFRQNDGDWFYSGHTHTASNRRIDPLNVFFHGGGGRQVNAGFMLFAGWPMHSPGGNPGCVSNQNIYDKYPKVDDRNDSQWVDHCYQDKFHARVWDSVEHDNAYPGQHSGNNSRQFDIAGIHYDDCCPDRPGKSWERVELRTIKKLSEYCSWRDDLRLPGSKGMFQGFNSDGRVTRISPEGVSEPGPCGGS
jgi:hypothetical protein